MVPDNLQSAPGSVLLSAHTDVDLVVKPPGGALWQGLPLPHHVPLLGGVSERSTLDEVHGAVAGWEIGVLAGWGPHPEGVLEAPGADHQWFGVVEGHQLTCTIHTRWF